MLQRSNRFHGHQSVRRVYRQGRLVRGKLLSLHVYADDRGRAPRALKAAVVVSKKVHKSAVVRNRIRRRVYEIVRLAQPELPTAVQLVFTVYSADVAMVPQAELQAAVHHLLQAAKQP